MLRSKCWDRDSNSHSADQSLNPVLLTARPWHTEVLDISSTVRSFRTTTQFVTPNLTTLFAIDLVEDFEILLVITVAGQVFSEMRSLPNTRTIYSAVVE